jgi:hypothetical protein
VRCIAVGVIFNNDFLGFFMALLAFKTLVIIWCAVATFDDVSPKKKERLTN